MNRLTARDIRRILSHLDDIKELTELLRRSTYGVPADFIYGASGSEDAIRKLILGVCIADIAVEPVEQSAEAA